MSEPPAGSPARNAPHRGVACPAASEVAGQTGPQPTGGWAGLVQRPTQQRPPSVSYCEGSSISFFFVRTRDRVLFYLSVRGLLDFAACFIRPSVVLRRRSICFVGDSVHLGLRKEASPELLAHTNHQTKRSTPVFRAHTSPNSSYPRVSWSISACSAPCFSPDPCMQSCVVMVCFTVESGTAAYITV